MTVYVGVCVCPYVAGAQFVKARKGFRILWSWSFRLWGS